MEKEKGGYKKSPTNHTGFLSLPDPDHLFDTPAKLKTPISTKPVRYVPPSYHTKKTQD
jgi:hypothetical protein